MFLSVEAAEALDRPGEARRLRVLRRLALRRVGGLRLRDD